MTIKPWEERWNLAGMSWAAWPESPPSHEHDAARMRLAECAPDLYRMLAKSVDGGFDQCFECGGINDRHRDGCALVALLKRARGET